MDAADTDPSPRAQDLLADQQHRDQRNQAESINIMDDVDQPVIVDKRQDEHRPGTADQPQDLLGLETDKLGMHRRRVDLKHADYRKNED